MHQLMLQHVCERSILIAAMTTSKCLISFKPVKWKFNLLLLRFWNSHKFDMGAPGSHKELVNISILKTPTLNFIIFIYRAAIEDA